MKEIKEFYNIDDRIETINNNMKQEVYKNNYLKQKDNLTIDKQNIINGNQTQLELADEATCCICNGIARPKII